MPIASIAPVCDRVCVFGNQITVSVSMGQARTMHETVTKTYTAEGQTIRKASPCCRARTVHKCAVIDIWRLRGLIDVY